MFKNAIPFRIKTPVDLQELESGLSDMRKKPIGRSEVERIGFIPAVSSSDKLLYQVDRFCFVALSIEEKVIPPASIKKEVGAWISRIEKEEGRSVKPKEKSQIKDAVYQEMLPKAFTKESTVRALYDSRHRLLIVDAASANKAEKLTGAVREALGSFPVMQVCVAQDPEVTMTEWIIQDAQMPESATIGSKATFVTDTEEKSSIVIRNLEMEDPDVRQHLQNGMLVDRLELIDHRGPRITFTLSQELTLKQIIFESDSDSRNDSDEAFIFLTANALTNCLEDLFKAFGGEYGGEEAFEDESEQKQLEGQGVA